MSVTIDGILIGDLIYWPLMHSRLISTSNYSIIANLYNSQITTEPAKTFSPFCVFTSRSLATASNSGDSSASPAESLLHRLPCRTHLVAPIFSVITSWHGPTKNPASNNTSIVAGVFVPRELFFTESLPRNGCHSYRRKHSSSTVACVYVAAVT
jgi:hypothetical protein